MDSNDPLAMAALAVSYWAGWVAGRDSITFGIYAGWRHSRDGQHRWCEAALIPFGDSPNLEPANPLEATVDQLRREAYPSI